jgi:hypothetical protein
VCEVVYRGCPLSISWLTGEVAISLLSAFMACTETPPFLTLGLKLSVGFINIAVCAPRVFLVGYHTKRNRIVSFVLLRRKQLARVLCGVRLLTCSCSSFSGRPWQATDVYCNLLAYCIARFRLQTLATRCPRAYRRLPLSAAKAGTYGNFAQDADSIVHLGIFYMPQILRHGTHGFTYFPKEGALRIFALKNLTASAGFEPANLGTRGQHANP